MVDFMRLWVFALFIPLFCSAQQWPTSPDTISTSGQDAFDQQIDMDPNGNIVAVWVENGVVQARSGTVSGGWNTSIVAISGAGSSDPQIQLDSSGNATALWVSNGVVQAAAQPVGGSWSTSPDTLSGSNASSPALVIDSSGNCVALWLENGVVTSATQLVGGSWSATPSAISASGVSAAQVAIGSNGTIVAVWQGVNNAIPTIYAATYQVGGIWTAAEQISATGLYCGYPQVAVGASGEACAVWFNYDVVGTIYSNVVLQSSQLPLIGAWSAPVNVSGEGLRNPAGLASMVVEGPNGIFFAAWLRSIDGASFNVEWSMFSGGMWSAPVQIVNQNLLTYSISGDIDNFGDLFLSWMYFDSTSSSLTIQGAVNDIVSVSQIFGNPWTFSSTGSNGFSTVAVNTSESAVLTALAWENYNGTNHTIQAITAAFPFLQSPSNLAVSQQVNDFGVVTELYNVLSWDLSSDPALVCYMIFRNGVYLGYVDASVSQYIDQNRTAGETVVYGVAPCDNRGIQGATVTITVN
jgi:hypothetical protein